MKRKWIAACMVLLGGMLFAGTYSGGSGTSGDPWQIADIDDLLELNTTQADWNNYNYYFIQTADIDAAACSTWNSGAGWMPIGNEVGGDYRFKGSYDGQGYVISGLYINRTGTDYVGFFGRTHSATIKDLGLTNVDIDGKTYVGGLVGYAEGGTITSCYSSGTVHSSGQMTGGLGGMFDHATVSNSYSSCGVSSDISSTGGFVGYLSGSVTINRCYASGNVSANSDYANCGGFVGFINADNTVNDCYSRGQASGGYRVGGFVGIVNGSGNSINRCFSSGRVNGWGSNVGGFIGLGGGASNSFFDAETDNIGTTSSGTNSGGAIGKTTEEMKTLETFTDAGWDFEVETTNGTNDYWDMDNSQSINSGYPFLSWENETEVALPITLASFEAVAMNGAVKVTWVTESESENAAFLLYRDEKMIAELEGAGTSSEPHSYSYTDRFVIPGRTYAYVLADLNLQGEETKHPEIEVEVKIEGVAQDYHIGAAYPNPFNPTTIVPLNLAKDAAVWVTLYDLRGHAVRQLMNGDLSAGSHALMIDGAGLSTGIYVVRVWVNDAMQVQKIALMK